VIPTRTLLRGFAPYEGEGADLPALDVSYNIASREASVRFMTLGFDIDEMSPDEVLRLLDHFIDFNDFEAPAPSD